ncbi:MAG: phage protein Gp36 family protein [Draconibacterium sp.]
MYLSVEELNSHLREETMQAIEGAETTLLTMAIKGAEAEAKGYLHKYDIEAIWAKAGDERDDLLLIWLKDIAVWHYINIANPGVDFSVRERRYQAAISWLKGVQKGDIVPDFPLPTDELGEEENTTPFIIGSNPRRSNHIY